MSSRLRIGVSCCMFHEDKQRTVFNGRPLLYVEESLPHFFMSTGALVYMLPTIKGDGITYKDLVSGVDALVVVGGVDVAPESYGESPLRPEWSGDRKRDDYESALIHAAIDLNCPILGVCRGSQILNVALGGSLYQDINTQLEDKLVHRNPIIYENNIHKITFQPESLLSKLFPKMKEARVNSVHHQAVKNLSKYLKVEALSEDGIVEAISLDSSTNFAMGLQWHPEFQNLNDKTLLDPMPILEMFLNEAEKRKS